MVFSIEDRILIENLHKLKRYGAKKLIQEFPDKYWNLNSLKSLLKKLRKTGRGLLQLGNQEAGGGELLVQIKTFLL